MRVALSVDALEPKLSGIGRYTLELARGLAISPAISELRFFRNREPVANPDDFVLGRERPPHRLLRRWLRGRNNRMIDRMRGGVVHAPNFFLPDWCDSGIATIHDLSVLRFPETHPQVRLEYFARRFQSTLARASRVITATNAMRSELVDTLGIPVERIAVIPHGVRRTKRPNVEVLSDTLAPIGLSVNNYCLCVATIEPRKRIGELIDAYEGLPDVERRQFPLVLVGKVGWLADGILERIRRAEASGWLRWLDFASNELLGDLYFGARLFVYPSLYEGFGLPPVEAMAHDVPVLIGDDPSVVEVSGAAAMVVDARDRSAFTRSIERGLQDEGWRGEAVAKGRKIVDVLTWERTVDRTVDVYREADPR